MRRPAFRLHIEELVLHSFAPNDRHAIAAALQQELSRLLAGEIVNPEFTAALAQHSGNGRLDAGAFHAGHESKPAAIGNQIAGAVHRGLSK